jgi:hypothetical protein
LRRGEDIRKKAEISAYSYIGGLISLIMKKILAGLAALAFLGCAHTLPFNSEYSDVRHVNGNTFASVERADSSLRLSVYTLEEGYDTSRRSWTRRDDAAGNCAGIDAYYMNEDENMEATLMDDGCDGSVDSIYLPFEGTFGRGVMTEAQRKQADDGIKDIESWLSDYFNFDAEVDAWHEWGQAAISSRQ